MKIAVTGGSGMVGRNLQDVVQEHSGKHQYFFLTRKDFDCEDRDAVMAHFEENKYDAIVHLAACVGGLFMHINNNQVVYEKNKRINDNIIVACVASGIKLGIFCSSSCVFTSDPPYFPMDESMHLIGETHPTNRGYANAKREMYQRCKKLNEEDGYKYMCLIPVNMYGKYDNFNIGTGHFVPALMHRFEMTKRTVRNASAFNSYSDIPTKSPYEEKYVAYGDGSPLRQLLYARDFAQIIYQLLLENNHVKWIYDSVIVCNDEEYTIKEVVEELASVMDLDKEKVNWDTSKANGCMRKTVSNARLKTIERNISGMGIGRFTSLNEGLREMYTWFRKMYNYDTPEKNTQSVVKCK
jgi:GDP-L-fucose synthase